MQIDRKSARGCHEDDSDDGRGDYELEHGMCDWIEVNPQSHVFGCLSENQITHYPVVP